MNEEIKMENPFVGYSAWWQDENPKKKMNPVHEIVNVYFQLNGMDTAHKSLFVGRFSYAKLAREANQSDIERAKKMIVQSTVDKEIAGSRIAMLAETLKNLHLSISEKVNNLGKLYGAINQDDIGGAAG